jgi:hypothetical protein
MMNQPVSAGILHSYGKRVVIFESQTDDRIERAEEVERLALMRVIIDQPTSGAPAAVATAMTTVTSALTAWSRELSQEHARLREALDLTRGAVAEGRSRRRGHP